MSSPSFCARVDDTFRIHALSCRGGFDFSLLFEELILGVLPLGIILLVVPFRTFHLYRSDRKVVRTILSRYKISAWLALAIIQLVLTVLWALPSASRTKASIAANAVMTFGALVLCPFSYMEHTRSVRPSLLLNLYLFSTLLLDTARTRTLWLRQSNDISRAIAIFSSVGVGIKLVLLLLEAVEKRRILKYEYKNYPPEATAGIANRAFFWWLNPLFRKGFSNVLGVDDLFVLDEQLDSKRLHGKLDAIWSTVDRNATGSLLLASFRALKWPIVSVIPPRACLVALTFCQPLLLTRSLDLSSEGVTDFSTNVGYGLIGAYILVYVGIAIMMSQQQHLTYRSIGMVRGALVSMIYSKASNMSTKDADPAASLTLMSADIERIVQGWQTMHELWANPIEIALAIFLLERQLGIACVVPVGVSVVALVGSMICMSSVISKQAKWLEAIEKRISSTASMLSSIKGVKMLGLVSSLMTSLQGLRVDELRISKGFRKLLVYNMAFAWLTRIFAPIISFGVFGAITYRNGGNSSLSVSKVYTSLSLFALLSDPLLSLVMALMAFIGSVGSFTRVQEFLQKESHSDSRHRLDESSRHTFHDDSQTLVFSGSSSIFTIESDPLQPLKRNSPPPYLDMITVQDGTFGWDLKKAPILKNITFSVPQRRLTMLVGPSGCGKSTLLKALLGEVPCLGGNVDWSSESVAYCDQTPWHMNGTIQESIIAMSDLDRRWYASVIRACALEEDLSQFPRGDQTVIGSKGIALSGGQSQRIALARAVYSRRKIIILDDSFSGLDAATENQIFRDLIGTQGLLRDIGSTIVLASSSAKRLAYADHIVVLDQEGRICEQGTFEALSRSDGYVSSFALGGPNWDHKGEKSSESRSSHVDHVHFEKSEWTEQEARCHTGDISIYLYYVQSIGWFPTAVFVIAMAGFVFCISFPSIWLKWWANSDTAEPNKHTGHYLGIYVMLGVLAMLSLMVGCWQVIVSMVPKSGVNFHKSLLKAVLSAPMLFFATTDSGSILNRFSQDLQLIDMELPVAAINAVATLFLCMAQMILVGVASIYAAISFPVVLLVLYVIQNVYLRTSRQLRILDLEAKAPLFSHFTDCLNGLVTLRAFGWQTAMEEKNLRLLDRSQRPFYYLFAVQRWLTLTLDLVVAGIAVILIVLVVALRGTLSAGYAGVALLNVILFSQTIKLLVQFWTNLETHIGSIARIKDFTEHVESEDLETENAPVPPDWPSKGAVEFRSISAAYRSSELVLKNISLCIQPGEKVGICGRTGSGKTSLILSVFRMLSLTSGTLTIDGIDISKIPRQEIRSRLNGVSQDPLLIKGTVRLNADPFSQNTDKAILSALKSVNLLSVVHEKGGLDAEIGDLFLSHGQKQLFCLARAILRPSNILILDEATSNVDSKTDEIMQRVIREKFCNHTILAVAHKLDTILDYDKVVVLEAGRIVECGDPYTLLSTESAFSKLYASSMIDEAD